MRTPAWLTPILMLTALVALAAVPALPADPGGDADDAPASELFPAITLDRAAGHVDVRGGVIGGPVEWLELLACRPGTREHESVVTLDARADHLHAALLLLGLTPGAPADARWEGQGPGATLVHTPPRGPALAVYFVFDDAPGQPVPAGVYVADQASGAPLDPAAGGWRFTGSRLVEGRQRSYFLAEENGTLISLVNFGDDLIARDTPHAADGGNGFWALNPFPDGWPPLPPAGTPLTVRLARVPAADGPAGASPPAAGPDNAGDPAPQR